MSAEIIRPHWLPPADDSRKLPKPYSSAFLDLEPLLRDVERMAKMAASEIGEVLDASDLDHQIALEDAVFAVNHVHYMVQDITREYYRLHEECRPQKTS